jgi:hypothetical protein
MATVTPQDLSLAGVAPTANAASAGGDLVNDPYGDTVLRVTNGSGASINATIAVVSAARPGDGRFPAQTISNQVVAVPAGASRLIGPVPSAFRDTNSRFSLAWSASASVTFEAFRIPR